MAVYRINFYSGSYRQRQESANRDQAICFVAHHLNSAGPDANDALCVVGSNAGQKSLLWAGDYVRRVGTMFQAPLYAKSGLSIGGMSGRGNSQLVHTHMPAILPEPLFASNPAHAKIIRSENGRQMLAQCLAQSIQQHFPFGGLVAFSVGHQGKPAPYHLDRGAVVWGEPPYMEAQAVEDILVRAKRLLEMP